MNPIIEPLVNLCTVFADGDWIETKDQSKEGIRLIQTGNVGFGYFKDKEGKFRFISEKTLTRLRCSEVFAGDCLISRLPDPVGRACILPDIGKKMITAVDCTIIRFNRQEIDPKYFNYYAQSNKYLEDVDKQTTGTTRKRISRNKLGEIPIPIFPLPEQQRIVAILDQAFDAIAHAKANTEKNLANARELFTSYLNKIFSTVSKCVEEKRFGDVADFVRGPFGSSLRKNIFVDEGYAVYEQYHAIYNNFTNFRYFISETKFNEMKRFEAKPGDLIMSCSGTMGKVAIIPENSKRGIINQALLLISPHSSILNTYLIKWMSSDTFQAKLIENSLGAAIQNIASVKVLKELRISLPPLTEQQGIVAKLDALSAETQKLEALYRQKMADLDELKRSILQKAFNGDL